MSFWSGPPQTPPPLETHFFEVLRGGGFKNQPPLFLVENHESFGFFILNGTSVPGSRLHGVCIGRGWTSAHAIYALFSHFWYVGCFGDLGDPVVSTLRGVSGDVMIVCLLGYERVFFCACSLASGRSKPVPKMRNGCFHQQWPT